jgi:hypothetical protein
MSLILPGNVVEGTSLPIRAYRHLSQKYSFLENSEQVSSGHNQSLGILILSLTLSILFYLLIKSKCRLIVNTLDV